MASSLWPEVRLGDLIAIKHGWPFASEFFTEAVSDAPIVVNIGNFRYTGGFRFDSTTIKRYVGQFPPEYIVAPGDILLVMTCQTAGGEILGIPGRIPNDGQKYLHNQRMGKVINVAPDAVDENFLYWLFLSPEFNRELATSASGTKILHTSPGRIEAFRFRLPPLAEQRAIARILGALDDKIELNRRMNETLEAIARALFQSWFVDFDPVRAKAEGRRPAGMDAATAALFPDSFEPSALGPIPSGWTLEPVESLATLDKGVSYKGEALSDSGVPMINLGCFRGRGAFSDENLKFYVGEYRPQHLVHPGDIVLANTDITQKREVLGSPALVPPNEAGDYIFTHHVYALRFRSGNEHWRHYIYYLLQQPEFRERAEGFATGTTVLALPRDAVLGHDIVKPADALVGRFSDQVGSYLSLRDAHVGQSRTLAAIRDALLPKLLSGAVRVGEAEQVVTKVGMEAIS